MFVAISRFSLSVRPTSITCTRNLNSVKFQRSFVQPITIRRNFATKDGGKGKPVKEEPRAGEAKRLVDGARVNSYASDEEEEATEPRVQKDPVKFNDPPLANDIYANPITKSKPDELDISKIPPHVHDLVDKISKLNILEVVELTKLLQEKLGISGMPMMAAPMMMAGGMGGVGAGGAPGAAGGAAAGPPPEEEKKKKERTEWNIRLVKINDGAKYKVIKELRELKPDLSLLDTKALVEKAPSTIAENVKKDDGEKIIKKMKDAGGEAEFF